MLPSFVHTSNGIDQLTIPSGLQSDEVMIVPMASTPWEVVIGRGARVIMWEEQLRASTITIEAGGELELITLHTTAATEALQKTVTLHDNAIVRQCSVIAEEIDVTMAAHLMGHKSVAEHHLVYIGRQRRNQHLQLDAHHSGTHTMSRTLAQGVATDQARVDISGMIHIAGSGQQTDGHLAHEGLLLSPAARINALPGFTIATNDVKAAHSSAVHYIKPEQLFYLICRGLPEAEARSLMIQGFLESMLGIMSQQELKGQLGSIIDAEVAAMAS